MKIIATHIVPSTVSKIRLSDYAIGLFEEIPSRKGIKKAIKKGAVLVDGVIATTGHWVLPKQQIQLLKIVSSPPKPYWLKLPVVYEDEEIALINKPAGIEVSGNQFRTIQNAILYNLKKTTSKDALDWAQPVHRLDYSTSGLLLIAKTHGARISLGQQFEQKTIEKHYQAIVLGQPPESGIIKQPINDKKAYTRYECIETVPSLKSGHLSLLNLYPTTGRTHQLRIHLSQLGYPILGDKLYGKEGLILKGKGLFLAAIGLTFTHPKTAKQLVFEIESPLKFSTHLAREVRRWKRINYKNN